MRLEVAVILLAFSAAPHAIALATLAAAASVLLIGGVYPVAAERRIVGVDRDGEITPVRRSPKRAGVVEVFDKLVAFPSLLTRPHLTSEVLLLREDHVRGGRPQRVGRRRRDPGERWLIDVLDRIEFRATSEGGEHAAGASVGSVQYA